MNKYFIYISILLYTVGTEIFVGLRLLDLFLVSSIPVMLMRVSKFQPNLIYLCSSLILFLCLNVCVSLIIGDEPNIYGFMLFAKVFIHTLSLFVIARIFKRLTDKNLINVFRLYLFITSILSAWCIISFMLEPFKRVGFPFSNSLSVDSHVLGSLLALSTLLFALNGRFDTWVNKITSSVGIFLTLAASFTTGSRSIAFLLIIVLTLVVVRTIINLNIRRLITIMLVINLLTALLVFGVLNFSLDDMRSVQFSMQHASEAKRLSNLINVFEGLDNSYYMFGRGLLNADKLYFDGSLTFMLYNFGLLGAVIFISFLNISGVLYILHGHSHFLFITTALSLLLVTEFFLLSRWFIPITIAYFYLYEQCKRSPQDSATKLHGDVKKNFHRVNIS